jgi:hypothetical protein
VVAGATFLIARDPDPDSTLPYLLSVPLEGGVKLKAKERWPATARVYCHPVDQWPPGAEVLEEVAVRHCARRGRAIDLTLDRARNNRSQFVFTEPHPGRMGGRSMIFWQTAKTAQRARPGQRAPARRPWGLDALRIDVDTRERYPYRFSDRPVECKRRTLPCGDYGVTTDDRLIGVVERKTLEDLINTRPSPSPSATRASSRKTSPSDSSPQPQPTTAIIPSSSARPKRQSVNAAARRWSISP